MLLIINADCSYSMLYSPRIEEELFMTGFFDCFNNTGKWLSFPNVLFDLILWLTKSPL